MLLKEEFAVNIAYFEPLIQSIIDAAKGMNKKSIMLPCYDKNQFNS